MAFLIDNTQSTNSVDDVLAFAFSLVLGKMIRDDELSQLSALQKAFYMGLQHGNRQLPDEVIDYVLGEIGFARASKQK